MKKINFQKGFTLVEVMIAMTIFVIFTGIIINSYTSIVRSQREANDYRALYAEARQVMSKITEEVRGGTVYFDEYTDKRGFNGSADNVVLVSKDGNRVVKIKRIGDTVKFFERTRMEGVKDCSAITKTYDLNSPDVKVSDLHFFVSPAQDPFTNVFSDVYQFQPKVTVYLKINENLDFQTTVSSRSYAETPSIGSNCIAND